jgi:hypothetical protein
MNLSDIGRTGLESIAKGIEKGMTQMGKSMEKGMENAVATKHLAGEETAATNRPAVGVEKAAGTLGHYLLLITLAVILAWRYHEILEYWF